MRADNQKRLFPIVSLAVITAIDAVAHRLPELARNMALVLNGQVGNAAACIELVGCDDGIGRADVDAGGAGATV